MIFFRWNKLIAITPIFLCIICCAYWMPYGEKMIDLKKHPEKFHQYYESIGEGSWNYFHDGCHQYLLPFFWLFFCGVVITGIYCIYIFEGIYKYQYN